MNSGRRSSLLISLAILSALVLFAVLGIWIRPAEAATPLYVRPGGSDTYCNGTVNVAYNGSNGPNCALSTIQKGVDLVSPGGTVEVAAGTYIELVTINRSLTLLGAQRYVMPTSANPRAGGESILRPPSSNPARSNLISVYTDTVTVDGFYLDGNNPALPECTHSYNGLCLHAAAGVGNGLDSDGVVDYTYTHPVSYATISHNIVKNMNHHGIALRALSLPFPTSTGNLISENFIENMQGSTNDGALPGGFYPYGNRRGIITHENQYADIINNRLRYVAIGIMVSTYDRANPGADVTISNNQISEFWNGIRVWNFYGTSEILDVSGNTLSAGDIGIDITELDSPRVIDITHNIFVDTETGVRVRDGDIKGTKTKIFNNDLSGTTTGVKVENGIVNSASGNWWGDPKVSIGVDVDCSPWLDFGTDTSTNPGFQGDFSSLTVDDICPQSGSVGDIDDGIGMAASGGTIHVSAGTYDESATLNKNVTVQAMGNIGINHNLSILQGVFIAPSGTLTLGGDFMLSGGTFNTNSGKVTFGGVSPQTIGGSLPTIFNNLEIANSSGVSLGQEARVNGNLSLSAGVLALEAHHLTLPTGTSILGTFNNSTMIAPEGDGQLCKEFSTTGSFTYPIGDKTGVAEYSPATLAFTVGSFAPNARACVSLKNQRHPQNYSYHHLNRYWTVNTSGVSGFLANVTFNYIDPADIFGSENELRLKKFASGSWVYGDPVNIAQDSMSMSGINSFSDFTAGTTPTNYVLDSFTALLNEDLDLVQLTWETISEEGVDGFNILRADMWGGTQQKLNPTLIAPTGGGSVYGFQDTTIQPGHTYYYWLEAVGADDPGRLAGPEVIFYHGVLYLPILFR